MSVTTAGVSDVHTPCPPEGAGTAESVPVVAQPTSTDARTTVATGTGVNTHMPVPASHESTVQLLLSLHVTLISAGDLGNTTQPPDATLQAFT